MSELKPYTVILLYPDYCAENYGEEVYQTCVQATDPKDSLVKARAECVEAQGTANTIDDPQDLFCIAVIAGEHIDIQPHDD